MAFVETPSEKLLRLIEDEESFSDKPYYDHTKDSGDWAIGYGNHYYEDGRTLVGQFDSHITKDKGESMLKAHIQRLMPVVKKLLKKSDGTTVDLTQNEFEALVSLAYNWGSGNLSQKGVNLINVIKANPKDYKTIAPLFIKCGVSNASDKAHISRRNREMYYYEHGVLILKSSYTKPLYSYSDTIFDNNYTVDESLSDASSSDSEKQIKYINTNYCSTVICDEYTDTDSTDTDTNGTDTDERSNDTLQKLNSSYNPLTGANAMRAVIALSNEGFSFSHWSAKKATKIYSNAVGFNFLTSVTGRGGVTAGWLYVDIYNSNSYGVKLQPLVQDYNNLLIKFNDITILTVNNTNLATTLNKLDIASLNNSLTWRNNIRQEHPNLTEQELFYVIVEGNKVNLSGDTLRKKFEDIINYNGSTSARSTITNAIYTLFTTSENGYDYEKVHRKNQYNKILDKCKNSNMIDNIGITSRIDTKRGLVYFQDISNKLPGKGYESYFNSHDEALTIVFGDNKIAKFSVEGFNDIYHTWNNFHLIK